jgi:hypothetical protein
MPRPPVRRLLRPALAALSLTLPPPLLHAALASAAGTTFEATPFVLAALFLRSPRTRRLAALASCGCGALPGALALPAVALCWLSFGPLVALLRVAAAAAGLALHRPTSTRATRTCPDPPAELETIAFAAFASALACDALRTASPHAGPLETALLFAAGAFAGIVSPCASAAVATSAGLRGTSAAAAAGLLATAGILPPGILSSVLSRCRFPWPHDSASPARGDGRINYALLGFACIMLVAGGRGGFVHPRLLPANALAAATCLYLTLRRAAALRTSASIALPLALAGALVAGSPLPRSEVDATNLADAYPGASVRFTGTAQRRGTRSMLVRYAITCCRADASPVALRTERRLEVRDGTWIEASGTLERDSRGEFVLRTGTWREIAPPADPFMYR